MERTIKPMEQKYLLPSLALVEDVFAKWADAEEGRTVRRLVPEQDGRPCGLLVL